MKSFFYPAFLLLLSTAAYCQAVTATLQKNSSLSILGTTNVVGFKLYQDGDKLANKTLSFNVVGKNDKVYLSDNKLLIPARNFTSSNKMALRDFLSLIKADKYPNLVMDVTSLDLLEDSPNENSSQANVRMNFGITGKQKEYNIPVTIKKNGQYYVVNGKKKLSIRDFGLEPTSYLMGTIVLQEWINVEFNLIMDFQTTNQSYSMNSK